MIDLRFVPITQWPGKTTEPRKNATFRTTYPKVLDKLEFELQKLGAREIVIQAFYTHEQLRNDGWPKATAKPTHPGVILSFKKMEGPVFYQQGKPVRKLVPLSFPCDTYGQMEHNIYAIALSLEALRAVDRYGVTKNAEQYTGWRQLEAPSSAPFASKEDAAGFILGQADSANPPRSIIADASLRQSIYRQAARRLHPDNPTGNHELFVRLQAANAMLEGQ